LPLKIFVREQYSGSPLTGYIKKGNWYYKARRSGVGVNISAIRLHGHFEKLLMQFEYQKSYKGKLKTAITEGLKKRLDGVLKENIQLKKRSSELQTQIEKLEERFVLGEVGRDLYEKYTAKYSEELSKIKEELGKSSVNSSNLEMVVEKGLQ
jgi:hypothetical protein